MKMKQLINKDIFDIYNLFELELYKLQHLPKTEQMKIRKKIDSTLNPVLRAPIGSSEDVLRIIEDRLYDILKLFRDKDNFIRELSSMLDDKFLSLEARAFAQLTKLDSKNIRQKLDEAGVSRSSNLRLVLARISRDSITIQDFISTVSLEAEKIADFGEIDLLSKLKEDQKLSSMKHILELLLEKTI